MRTIDRVASHGSSLTVFWPDGGRGTWPAIWLRDQCACALCRHPSGQRLFEIGDLPERPEIASATLQSDGAVRIVWKEEVHPSTYPAAFLSAHDLNAREKRSADIALWGAALSELPEGDWPAVARNPAAELAWLQAYRAHGFALLRNVPARPGMVAEVGDRIGFVRTTNYGKLFDVISVPDPNNLANTALGLGVHSDNPYRDPTPGVQLLHCLVSDAPGGDSLLVDGFAAAEQLRAVRPDQFDLLTRVPASFRFADKDADLQARAPLITVDFEGRVAAVHFNNRSFAGIDAPVELVEPWYAAYRSLARILKRPERELIFRLAPGDLLVMQNERALHGRTAFDPNQGRRHLQGCYVDKDGLESRMRVLRRQMPKAHEAAE
ncbi:MAG: 2-trimethylaminoethylphosphonate dioxygenase [Dongiaceae bacterium]